MSHQAPGWSGGRAARPADSSEVHSRIKPWSPRPETPAPPWRSCTGPPWIHPPSESDRGGVKRTRRMSTRRKRRGRSFYLPELSEPSAPTDEDRGGKVGNQNDTQIHFLTFNFREHSGKEHHVHWESLHLQGSLCQQTSGVPVREMKTNRKQITKSLKFL